MVRDFIETAPNYELFKRGETPRETARNVYDVALSVAGLPADEDQNDPLVMVIRSAGFLIAVQDALEEIELELMDECGMIGGVVPAKMDDIKHAIPERALDLMKVELALLAVRDMRGDMRQIIADYRSKQDTEKAA